MVRGALPGIIRVSCKVFGSVVHVPERFIPDAIPGALEPPDHAVPTHPAGRGRTVPAGRIQHGPALHPRGESPDPDGTEPGQIPENGSLFVSDGPKWGGAAPLFYLTILTSRTPCI